MENINKKEQDILRSVSISETCKPLLKKSTLYFVKKNETENFGITKYYNVRVLINCLISILSFMLMILFWLTDAYNQIIVQHIVLRNNTEILQWYLKPPFAPIVNVYVFNYTNIENYMAGIDKKLKVKEVGPYVYEEPVEKINLRFEKDTLTFNENRTHIFIQKLSGNLSEDDIIIAPNIPLISALPNVAKMSFVSKVGFNALISMSKPKEFQSITVRNFLHGYRDDFMNLISKIKWDFTPEDVGLLAQRRGISKQSVTVNIGTKDSYSIGKVTMCGDKTKYDIWKSSECNEISGHDGIFNGPELVRNKQPSSVFLPELCRTLPLVFKEKAVVHKNIPAFLYVAPENVFSKPNNDISSDYYCELKSINYEHINGVLDISDCIDGSPPAFASHPHFREGDERLFEHIEGLSPNRSIHQSYAYLHPRLSVPMLGTSRMQMSLKLSHYNKLYQHYPNNLILPLGWVETTTDVIPDEFKSKLYLSTVVVDTIEVAVKYGSLFTFIGSISLHLLFFMNKCLWMNHDMMK